MNNFDTVTQQILLREVSENTQDAIVITNAYDDTSRALEILYVNRTFVQLTGYEPHEVIGRSPRMLLGTNTDRDSETTLRTAIQSAQPAQVEILNDTKKGEELRVEVNLFPILNAEGQVTNWVAITRPIHSEDLVHISALLARERELTQLKSQFILMMSHESRTHLATVLSSIDLLDCYSNCISPSEKKDLYMNIRHAVDRLVGLFSDVLVLEQSAKDFLSFKPAPLNLKQFCENLVSETRTIATSAHQIRLDFPDFTSHVIADEDLLHHIFSNLLTNAVKYSPEGGMIELTVEFSGQSIVFQIRDQGIGIPAGAMAHLFESFYRADNVAYISGTGLGLSIVKTMVDKHNGQIECESQQGVGSTFRVVIPLEIEAAPSTLSHMRV